jgi:hypothetical protein
MQAVSEQYDDITEELLDFDPFLVGEGNAETYRRMSSKQGSSFQLTGVSDFKDLFAEDQSSFCMMDDFPVNTISPVSRSEASRLFLEYKKRCYDLFNYTEYKSSIMEGPARLSDLVLTPADNYLIKYLAEEVFSESAVINLAQLSAYRDLRIPYLRIESLCSCPLCACMNNVSVLLEKVWELILARSDKFSCAYNFLPLIYDRSSLVFNTLSDLEQNGIKYTGIPIELISEITSIEVPVKDVRFINFSDLNTSEYVLMATEKYVLVHNLYVSNKSPADFLREWVKGDSDAAVTCNSSDEILYYKGKQVTLNNGYYFDIESGERV